MLYNRSTEIPRTTYEQIRARMSCFICTKALKLFRFPAMTQTNIAVNAGNTLETLAQSAA